MTTIVLALLGAASAYESPRARSGDWPQWLGPTRNNVSDETLDPWADEPRVVWKKSVGNGFSTPVIAGGLLYAHAAVTDQDAEEVIAFNVDTGDVLWRDSYERAHYESALGVGPRATPTVVGGRLYTLGITGVMSCYDAKSGQRLWQANPFDELGASQPVFGACSSPVVVDERIILPVGGEGSGVVAYDAQTGKVAWKAFDEPAGSASPVLLVRGAGDQQFNEVVVQTTLRLAGVDPLDGKVRWEHALVFEPTGVSPTPLAIGDILVCSTQDNGTLALSLPTTADAQPTLAWWNQDVSSYFSTGAVGADGNVFIVTNSFAPLPRADIRCIKAASGEQVWHKEKLGYFHVGAIFLAGGKLLVLDDAGNLILADVSGSEYKELCKSKVCGGTFMNPLLSNGKIYVRDAAHVLCLDPRPAAPAAAGAEGSE